MGKYPFIVRPPDDGFLDAVRARIVDDIIHFQANRVSPGRKFLTLDDEQYSEMKHWLADHFELGDWKHDPWFHNLIGHVSKGAAIHPHTDPSIPGRSHVRVNLLVNPGLDCHPILDGKQFECDVGEAWLNLAALVTHSTTVNQGEPRSVISFGYHVELPVATRLYKIHTEWLSADGGRVE